MAETMTLRAYLDDVKRLLDRGAATEVISHCRYILQHYPRNVETYRLLGQALLQKAQDQGSGTLFDEAIEVFQRVLGVLPGDHVAHIGLSEIREHEGRLDQAIWHLERAYEQIPGNPMLQEGLRTLYAKRDGDSRTPAKIHLTRGALARQYVNGQLYDQALIELRHALEQNPARLDLQVMLAETLFESHHVVEAGEVALHILKKLPDCLPANRIMARLWLDNERPSDAQVFLDRVEALDPYAAAQVLMPGANLADPNQIIRMDYGTEAQATLSQGTPDWVQDLGAVDIGTVFQAPPAAALESRADDVRQPTGSPLGGDAADDGLSFDWFTGQNEPADEPDGDWFAMLDENTPDETASGPPAPSDAGWLSSTPAEPGSGLPDWFAELGEPAVSPAESAGQPPVEADWLFGMDEFEIPADLVDETPASESPVVEPAGSDWMAGFDSLEANELDLPGAVPADVPDWLSGAGPVQEELATGADALGWLESDLLPDTLPPAAEAEPISEPSEPIEKDWLTEFGSVDSSAFEVFEEEQGASELAWLMEEAAPTPELLEPGGEEEWLAEFDPVGSTPVGVDDEQGVSEAAWPAEEPEVPPALDEILGEPEVSPVDELAESDLAVERPSSGFTEILAGVESWSSEPGEDEIVQEEPLVTPPEWLAAVAEDNLTGEAQPQETLLSAESAKALLGEDSFSWDDTQEDVVPGLEESVSPEKSEVDALSAASDSPAWDRFQDQEESPVEPEAVPDWLTEPENDFFALPSEQPGEPSVLSEDALRAELAADTADWLDEQAMVEESAVGLAEPESEPLVLPEDEAEAGWLSQQSGEDTALAEMPVSTEDEQEVESLEFDDWADSESAPALEVDEPAASGAALDWLQPQSAEIDWLSSFAKPPTDELDADLLEPDETLSFSGEEISAAPEPVADEWELSGAEAEVAFEEGTGPLGDDAEQAAQSYTDVDTISTGAAFEAEGSAAADDTPAWMADLPPIELDEAPAGLGSDLLDQPYDPFEGGSADNVPEYRSAKETGILQPNESPDWMVAFGNEEAPVDLEEEPEIDVELEDQESFLAALGIESADEASTDQEPETNAVKDSLTDFAAQAEDEMAAQRDLAEDAGGMPDWLAAITTSAAGEYGELFDEDESYSPSAEASGVVSERELDWLEPLGEADDDNAEEPAGSPLDLEAVFGDAALPEAAPDAVAVAPVEEEAFDFDFDARVAPADDSADTKGLEDEAPWLEDDDESVPDDFSFEEIVPRWLREPKEGDRGASLRHDDTPQAPNWLRDVFDDEDTNE